MRTRIISFIASIQVLLATPGLGQESQPSTPLSSALKFFEAFTTTDANASLRALRTVPVPRQAREAARATLPAQGALEPTRAEVKKLGAVTPVLIYHERDEVFDIKVIDLPQGLVGLHARAILLISRPALALLTTSELQAVVAHEIAHDFFWGEFEQAMGRQDGPARQQLELQCDGIAALTLVVLGLDPTRLLTAAQKLKRFNEQFGTPSNAADYPTSDDRERFLNSLLRNHQSFHSRDQLGNSDHSAISNPHSAIRIQQSAFSIHQFMRSPRRPLPRDRRSVLTRNDRFPEPLLERYRSALGQGLQRINQRGRVRNDQHLRTLRGAGNQTSESRQQIRVQAGLGLVQHQ